MSWTKIAGEPVWEPHRGGRWPASIAQEPTTERERAEDFVYYCLRRRAVVAITLYKLSQLRYRNRKLPFDSGWAIVDGRPEFVREVCPLPISSDSKDYVERETDMPHRAARWMSYLRDERRANRNVRLYRLAQFVCKNAHRLREVLHDPREFTLRR
ncbi:hypothetical protein [Corynebacterium antarcticum]|uniref:hypothetical protein n=1 Tax=Corynebacterium antarcticum TaxID=2800405 RepID=UPI0020049540|nr:hypothetical protein [Corynebacterium antarcticum]MCK7661993.1 hypothetical protein [Corynebacterium antarcticum]